ncbi:hypothetical protein [Bradyrhizobium canariense]|uniref:hypothetical protein n=1 Tax=Bradyrhizobium canariense TaxID=255045 RepID=UPI000A198921|nr:hypothetical protein [Bradyrhizobium canariense]OSI24348.1 hypothetical protein BST65_17445 [Bradyrhizobium canariense]OSI29641.1 hypothetical protein BST66_24955 [Bradyrhizobium canariense]OSI46472.1 hypothetical protein BSZ20_10550 [Bradyrhizobium canariense]OSI53911.1 hypothetical protein BST67_07955 [Bradyrhizobium canariense]OSI56861.1 hypothetical protein BSZ15_15450 [Bradyrhizobium canariense]
MLYVQETLDRQTGLLATHPLGEFITVTELGNRYRVGPKRVRIVLHHMGVLAAEGRRYRLPRAFVDTGLGVRHDNPRSGHPFDVLSPKCQALIAEAWDHTVADLEREAAPAMHRAKAALDAFSSTRRRKLTTQEAVCWLCDNHPRLLHRQMADILGVTAQLVSRFAKLRAKRLNIARKAQARGEVDIAHS